MSEQTCIIRLAIVLQLRPDLSSQTHMGACREKGIRLESLSLSFSTPSACVSAGHVTPACLLEDPRCPLRLKGHWHHCSPLCPHTVLSVERWKKKGHGNDDVSEIIKRIDLCAAITGFAIMGFYPPLCEAYFTSCTTKPLYIVSNELYFVENYSPCTTARDKNSTAARGMRINVFA